MWLVLPVQGAHTHEAKKMGRLNSKFRFISAFFCVQTEANFVLGRSIDELFY